MTTRVFMLLAVAGSVLGQHYPGLSQTRQSTTTRQPCVPKVARADIIFGSSDQIGGAIALSQDCPDHPVSIVGRIVGLNPNQKHGMHIHEFPNLGNACRDAGGHYNPFNTTHGGPEDDITNRHVGDLGNIQADYNGVADINILDDIISLFPGERNVISRAVVIHEGEDDLGRGGDPSSLRVGNAGGRLGCGVIAPNNDVCQ